MTVVILLLLVSSWIFIIFGAIAVMIIKDIYLRLLSASLVESFASIMVIIALIIASFAFAAEGWVSPQHFIRLILLLFFLLITYPISVHVVIRSAYLTGVEVKHLLSADGKHPDKSLPDGGMNDA